MKKVLIFLIFLAGCSTNSSKKSDSRTPKVEIGIAKKQAVEIYISAIGNIVERSIVQIRPQVQGILKTAYVKQGQEVIEGELLYEIDSKPFQASLEQALATLEKDKAILEQAKIVVERNKELVSKDYIPKITYEQYETNVKTAEAQISIDLAEAKKAKINLDYCKITSPINGKISIFNIYPGSLVTVNDARAITEIREIHPIDVRFNIPQREFEMMQQVKSNWPLKFTATLPKDNSKIFEGTINFIDNHIDLNTGTILLRGSIDNKERMLWPGEFVNIKIFLKEVPDALVIPASAIQMGSKGSFVYVVKEDKVEATYVEPGEIVDSNIVILSGLKPDDKVVTNGQLNLKNDSKIEVVK